MFHHPGVRKRLDCSVDAILLQLFQFFWLIQGTIVLLIVHPAMGTNITTWSTRKCINKCYLTPLLDPIIFIDLFKCGFWWNFLERSSVRTCKFVEFLSLIKWGFTFTKYLTGWKGDPFAEFEEHRWGLKVELNRSNGLETDKDLQMNSFLIHRQKLSRHSRYSYTGQWEMHLEIRNKGLLCLPAVDYQLSWKDLLLVVAFVVACSQSTWLRSRFS